MKWKIATLEQMVICYLMTKSDMDIDKMKLTQPVLDKCQEFELFLKDYKTFICDIFNDKFTDSKNPSLNYIPLIELYNDRGNLKTMKEINPRFRAKYPKWKHVLFRKCQKPPSMNMNYYGRIYDRDDKYKFFSSETWNFYCEFCKKDSIKQLLRN